MMKKNISNKFNIALLGLLVLTQSCNSITFLKPGDSAPNFKSKSSMGMTSLKKLYKNTDHLFLYAIDKKCPFNAKAAKYYMRVLDNYKKHFKGKVKFIGIINGNQNDLDKFKKKHKWSDLEALFDPDEKIVTQYKIRSSPWLFHIGKDKKIKQVWQGYSKKDFRSLNKAMSQAVGKRLKKIDVEGAPKFTRAGCIFQWVAES